MKRLDAAGRKRSDRADTSFGWRRTYGGEESRRDFLVCAIAGERREPFHGGEHFIECAWLRRDSDNARRWIGLSPLVRPDQRFVQLFTGTKACEGDRHVDVWA
jgi:hypothetical protein